jgi:penicillin-binding protein 2
VTRAFSRRLRLAVWVTFASGCSQRAAPSPPAASPPPPAASPPPAPSGAAPRATDVQHVVDSVLSASAAPVAAVVLDVEGPRVLALGRHLGADPVTALFRPGSTVKPLTAWVAAEEGVLGPRETVACDQVFPGVEGYRCFAPHGSLDLPSAIATSCNVYFYELGARLGLERVANGLMGLGLARRTELVDGEAVGFVATPAWVASQPQLAARRHEVVVAAGHGPLEVTLLELAVAYARLGAALSAPHPRVPDALRAEILTGLRRVVNGPDGTGRAAAVPGLDLVGKTGTAEGTSFAEDRAGAKARPENGWFVGFTPSERPSRVVAVVVLGQGSGGKTAAPIAGRLFAGLR